MDWSLDKLTSLATGYWQSATLIAAVQLGIFDSLDVPRSAERVAETRGTDLVMTRALLDALASIEILFKHDAEYALAPSVRPLLERSSPTCMLDALRYNADLYRQWGSLAESIRSGQPAGAQASQLGRDPMLTRRFVMGMESKARAFLPAVAPLIHLNGERSLLDVGSGPGTLSRHFAETKPTLRVTMLDLPDVLTIAREICATSPANSRIDFFPADYRQDALPGTFDVVLFAGALHQETPASAEQLYGRFFRTLAPGGRLVIVDLMLDNDDRTRPAFSALFQLTMLLIQPGARVFSMSETSAILIASGFKLQPTQQPDSSPYRIIVAQKPEHY